MAKIKKNKVILTAREILQGYTPGTTDVNLFSITPLQMIPEREKTEEWKMWNMDWLERVAMRQLSRESKKLIRAYHMANGILNKSDYMIGEDNDLSNEVEVLVNESSNTIPIRFYPIIPNVINVLCGEFSKRNNVIIAKAVDETSINEKNEQKEEAVRQILMEHAEQKKMAELQALGFDFNSQDPKVQDQIAQEMETSRKLVEIENRFKKYRGRVEQWANHMIQLDNQRFAMYQLEGLAFRDMLIADREFWHIKLLEDDYKVEIWNPIHTFYHKSPDVQWISEGNYVGRMLMMSIPDVIDSYGHLLNDEQIEQLKEGYRITGGAPMVDEANKSSMTDYNDYSKPYPGNVTNVTMEQWKDRQVANAMIESQQRPLSNMQVGSWHDIKNASKDYMTSMESPSMVRVTEAYWKSQIRRGELTSKVDGVDVITTVDENFQVTHPPIYDNSITQKNTADNLVSGEHVEWFYDNQVRWGLKINSSMISPYAQSYSSFKPVYAGGDPIVFQFEGNKLPVEGKIFSERNSFSSSMVDKMMPDQISYNIVRNQMVEMAADNGGPTLVFDQNSIPTNSFGGEWGKNNFAKFQQVIKEYGLAPFDTSMRNQEGATNFNQFQMVDMSRTQQILGHIQLAEYLKNRCFEVVGITPQRVGAVAASESATGVQQAVNNSYSQTEPYFDQHMNYLMPRVRQMMLDAAQFINATKPVSRIAYLNSNDEDITFDLEGPALMGRDFRIYARSTADVKAAVEELKQMARQNNTAEASLGDLARILTLQSPSEIIAKLDEAAAKRQEQVDAQRQHESEMQQAQQEFLMQEEDKKNAQETAWRDKAHQVEIIVAQIRASQSKDNDVNMDGTPDPLQALDIINKQQVSSEQLLNDQRRLQLDKEKHQNDTDINRQKLDIEREKMASQERIEAMKLRNPVSGEKKKK